MAPNPDGGVETTPGALPRVARACCRVFAAMLLVSAFAKARSPGAVATALYWTGLDFPTRDLLAGSSVWIEALLGALLLAAPTVPPVLTGAAILATGLLAVHLAGLAAGGGCACFGELKVPDWLTLTGLLLGIAGAILARRAAHSPADPRALPARGSVAAVLAAAAVSPLWFPGATPPAAQLVRHADLPDDEVVFVVGSFDCRPCEEALQRIATLRPARVRVHFVTPLRGSFDPTYPERFPWLAYIRVPEHLWLELSRAGSPTYVYHRAGAAPEFGTGWPLAQRP